MSEYARSRGVGSKDKSTSRKMYRDRKKYFPKHMQEMWEIYRRFSNINTIKVIDELLERGTLKPLTQTQRKGVMIILYSDFLPVRDEV